MTSVIDTLGVEATKLQEYLLAELPKPPDLLADSFQEQRHFILDPAPLKAAYCTRRAAKSYSVGLENVLDSFNFPNAHYLFLMTVRAQAERDFWNDVLKAINQKYSIGMKFNETKLIATMPNKAMIYVGGADSSGDEWRKLIAGKYRKVHIDEAQGFIHSDLRTLVYEAFKPAVADYRGSIGLSGTPGIVTKGLFYDVTQGKETGWSLHKWDTFDNPFMAKQWQAEIDELKNLKPGVELTPWFRRNYLGEWVVDDSDLVYKFNIKTNSFSILPPYASGGWHYVLGCDLGYKDPTAWVVCTYHDHDPCLYILEAFKESGLDVTSVANRTKILCKKYEFDVMIIDNANRQAVEEMRKRHGLPWQPASKTGKEDFIEIMNGEFLTNGIKIFADGCLSLADEYANLVWNETRSGGREEHSACANHCTDAALYAWRFCYPYISEALKEEPVVGTTEWQERQVREMMEAEIKKIRENREAREEEEFSNGDYF